MNKVTSFLRDAFALNCDASLFETNENEIQRSNLSFLRQISFAAALILLAMFAASMVLSEIQRFVVLYFMMFMLSAIIFAFTLLAPKALLGYIYPLIYFYTFVLMAFYGVIGVYYNTDKPATVFAVLIAVLPLMILDKPKHVITYSVAVWACFCIATLFFKDSPNTHLDIINSTAAMLVGILLNGPILKARLSAINSSRIISRQVEIDGLTGLLNYKKLMQDLSGESGSGIARSIFSIAVFEIDNFLGYNTKYGRENGDKCLRRIGAVLQRVSDPSELIFYRYGGTRLAAISLIHDYKSMHRVCTGVSSLIKDLDIEFIGSPTGKITISSGYADVVECECDDPKMMLDYAMQALSEAGKRGGNASLGWLQLVTAKHS